MSINFGHSDRLGYDDRAYKDRIIESTSPMVYKLEPMQYTNDQSCVSFFGPRPSYKGVGVSTVCDCRSLPHPDLTDVESILSNRNVKTSKAKRGKLNNVNVTKYKLHNINECNDFLHVEPSKLNLPPSTFREMSINRFHDLPRNPQANIYWDSAINTTLQSKDNFKVKIPIIKSYDPALPKEINSSKEYNVQNCLKNCSTECA